MKKLILILTAMSFCLPIADTFAEGDIDEYTVLMLHCNGEDTSTNIIDSSSRNHTVTVNGDICLDTQQKKFGTASCSFDGSGDYLTLADSEDWNFGTGDFTIDFWVNFEELPQSGDQQICVLSQQKLPNSYMTYFSLINADGQYSWYLTIQTSDGSDEYRNTFSTIIDTYSWHHISLVRNGNNWYVFQDGTQCGSTGNSSANCGNYDSPLYIGIYADKTSYALKGHMDEIRISKGVARWISNFTPPAYEYNDIPNNLPIANAGADVVANVGEEVTLDGSSSYDSDGEIVSWRWESLSDPQKPVVAEGEITTMKAHGYAAELIELTVTDNRGGSSTDTVMIINPSINPEEIAALQNQINALQQQNTQQQNLIDQNRYLIEQLPQLKKKIEELEQQVQ